jgi:23S rRNA pseudouridine1911/1915/1917 synthase
MAGKPLKELCALISGLKIDEAEKLIEFGAMWINNRQILDPKLSLPGAGEFRLNFPAYGPVRFYEVDPQRIVFEDDALLVYDKESGRPSQAVPHDAHNNVLASLTRLRGGILRLPHRLDAGTSGLLIVAKSLVAASALGKAFQKGQIKKRYLALSVGDKPPWDSRSVNASIAKSGRGLLVRENGPGLAARTDFKLLSWDCGMALILAKPLTGRTHQIRLHLSYLGYPIKGDQYYGGEAGRRLMLKATGLAFKHPISGEPMVLGDGFEEL